MATRCSPANPQETVVPQRHARSQRAKHLPRAGRQRALNDGPLPTHGGAVSLRVLDRQDQPNRPRVLRREHLTLPQCGPVLQLEVNEQPLNLNMQDLPRAEEDKVRRTAVVTGGDLDRRLPDGVRNALQKRRHSELAGIAQARLAGRVCPQGHVEPNGTGNCEERVGLRPAVTRP
jgi:hypothetical protein